MEVRILFSLFNNAAGAAFAPQFLPLTTVRADPIVTPGRASGHVHQVYGGNAFKKDEMSYDDARAATCNTSPFVEDQSNYWTNALYRANPDGSFTLVPTRQLNVYYKTPDTQELLQQVEPFPENFRMAIRRKKFSEEIRFLCMGSEGNFDHPTLDDLLADDRPCEILQVRFGLPQCWNGDLDSDSHEDHVEPTHNRDLHGKCPSSHSRRLPQLFFEVEYSYQKSKEEHPRATFIFSDNEKVPHGDFLNGWDVGKLRKALQCANDMNCVNAIMTSNPERAACTIAGKSIINEEVDNVDALPGIGNVEMISRTRAIGVRCLGIASVVMVLCS